VHHSISTLVIIAYSRNLFIDPQHTMMQKYSTFRWFLVHFICFVISVLFLSTSVQAQTLTAKDKILSEQLSKYSRSKPNSLLFLHLDKTVYTNNEQIWLCGYLLKSLNALSQHSVLLTALIRDDNKQVCLQRKFDMQDGIAYGSIPLPDSIAPGRYHLVAYTDVFDKQGQPTALFKQPIAIKSISEPGFSASLQLLESQAANGEIYVKVAVDLQGKNIKSKEKPEVTFTVGNSQKKYVTLDKELKGTIIVLPEELKSAGPNPVLLTTVSHNYAQKYLALDLPNNIPSEIKVQFFPEGGSLVDGLWCTVGWEATTKWGKPLLAKGILYKDNIPIDTFMTTRSGRGKFKLSPDFKAKYHLKVSAPELVNNDTTFNLPSIKEKGVILRVKNAVADDTLRLDVFSKRPQKVHVVVHNYQDIYASFFVKASASGGLATVILEVVPRGIGMITVLDVGGIPLAERMFFAHYRSRPTVLIATDKKDYSKKEKVTLGLKLIDASGNPIKGLVSLACVQTNRLTNDLQDIESYSFLYHDLPNLRSNGGREIDDTGYLEDALLLQGWRTRSWGEIVNSESHEPFSESNGSTFAKGQVKVSGKKIKKPVELNVFTDIFSDVKTVTTDLDGHFILGKEDLIAEDGKKVTVSVNKENNEGFLIEMADPFEQTNRDISRNIQPNDYSSDMALEKTKTNDMYLEGLDHSVLLQDIIVSAKRITPYSTYATKARGSNDCGDYVEIRSNYLNYPPARDVASNRPPIKGQQYIDGLHYRRKSDGVIMNYDLIEGEYEVVFITYQGCDTDKGSSIKIDGIYSDYEFYGLTKDIVESPIPQYLSTLFWTAGSQVSDKGETDFSFFTSDIEGEFSIIVQGVGEKGVMYGEAEFTVR